MSSSPMKSPSKSRSKSKSKSPEKKVVNPKSKIGFPKGVTSDDLPFMFPHSERRGNNKLVEPKVLIPIKLIAKMAAFLKTPILTLMTAQQYAWIIYDSAIERGKQIEIQMDFVACATACLSLAFKKRCRDHPNFQDLLGCAMLQAVNCKHSELKQYSASFVRDMQPRVEEYESFLLHVLGIKPDFEDPENVLEDIVVELRSRLCDEFSFNVIESIKNMAIHFIGMSGFTRALFHFGATPRGNLVLCTAALVCGCHVLRHKFEGKADMGKMRKDILKVVAGKPFGVKQQEVFQCVLFIMQGLALMCHDDFLLRNWASKCRRGNQSFLFIMRNRDGTHAPDSPGYEKMAIDGGKRAKVVADRLKRDAEESEKQRIEEERRDQVARAKAVALTPEEIAEKRGRKRSVGEVHSPSHKQNRQ